MLLLKVKNPWQKQVQPEPDTEGRILRSEKFKSDIRKLLEKRNWNSQTLGVCHLLARAPELSIIRFFSSWSSWDMSIY